MDAARMPSEWCGGKDRLQSYVRPVDKVLSFWPLVQLLRQTLLTHRLSLGIRLQQLQAVIAFQCMQ